MEAGWLIGIDYGGTNVKAIAISPDGQIQARAALPRDSVPQCTYTVKGRQYGGLTDPEDLVVAARRVLRELLKAEPSAQPLSLAISASGPQLIAVGKDGRAVCPSLVHWPQVPTEDLDAVLPMDPEQYRQETGYPRSYHPGVFQLAWLMRHDPEARARTVRVMSITDYVASRLSGVAAAEISSASASGAWSQGRQTWSDGVLAAADVPRAWFMEVGPSGRRLGRYTEAGTAFEVSTGGHDYLCAALATGVEPHAMCLDVVGTWEVVARFEPVRNWPVIAQRVHGPVLHDVDVTGHWITTMLESFSAGQLEWARKLLGLSPEAFFAEASRVEVQASRARHFAPFLGHQLFPWKRMDQVASLWGLDSTVSRGEVARMICESLAYLGARMVDLLDKIVERPAPTIVVTGGPSRSAFLSQLKADMVGRAIYVHDEADLSPIGAALISGVGAGVFPSLEQASTVLSGRLKRVDPRPDFHALYRQYFDGLGWIG